MAKWVLLRTLSIATLAAAHPGTWDGKVIMNENGAPLPDLTGHWVDSNGGSFTMQLFDRTDVPAAPPNSTYIIHQATKENGFCNLTPVYDYNTRKRLSTKINCQHVHSNNILGNGNQQSAGHVEENQILWNDQSSWVRSSPPSSQSLGRFSDIHTVHVVFMNHYDVGYTDYVNGVDNTYTHKYFPQAESMAQEMRANHSDAFVYTTHPWLMQRFLACPCPGTPCLATSLNNSFEDPLQCPSQAEIDSFTAAAKRGDIVWNGAPFNIQPENMSPELFKACFDLVRRMDARFGRPPTRTMSIRDVIYVTRAVLSHLAQEGITGLTIGSNGADVPPQVPKLHRWLDPMTKSDIIVAYHPYGYGGYGHKDCAEAPNGVALCTEFRTDNTGPPTSVDEVESVLNQVRQEYPGAKVISSTFDAFMQDVIPVKDQLPTIELEVADTWTYGTPSDPLKMAQHRAIQRVWIKCLASGDPLCALTNPAIQNMTFFLMKAPEHTWGTPGISGWGGSDDYNVSRFRSNLSHESYMRAAASWTEQRLFNDLAVLALEEANHPLAKDVRQELAILEDISAPDVTGFEEVPLETIINTPFDFKLGFGTDGTIVKLEHQQVQWASEESRFAGYVYQTFNDTEWAPFTYAYLNDHQMEAGFCKPGSNNFSESALWRPTLKRLLVKGGVASATSVVAVMEMPQKANAVYGAPHTVYLSITTSPNTLDLSFTTLGKLPAMIGESTMVTFRPAPALVPQGSEGSAWRLRKLGQEIDPEGVVDGGQQFTHGVWNGATAQTVSGKLTINPIDAPNMNPMTDDFPIGNPLPASYIEAAARSGKGMSRLVSSSVHGMAANLHNNLWNTNYPLFYPYYDAKYCFDPLSCSTSNSLSRFQISIEPTVQEALVI